MQDKKRAGTNHKQAGGGRTPTSMAEQRRKRDQSGLNMTNVNAGVPVDSPPAEPVDVSGGCSTDSTPDSGGACDSDGSSGGDAG